MNTLGRSYRSVAFAGLILACSTGAFGAYSIPPSHPRIFFTSSGIAAIAERCKSGGTHRQHYEKLVAFSNYGISHGKTDSWYLPNYALVYKIHLYWNQTGYNGGGFEEAQYWSFVRTALLNGGAWGIDSNAACRAIAADWIWERLSQADISALAPLYGTPSTYMPDAQTWRDATTFNRLTSMLRSLLFAGSNVDTGSYSTEYQVIGAAIETYLTSALALMGGIGATGPTYEPGLQPNRAWFLEAFSVAAGIDAWALTGRWAKDYGQWPVYAEVPHRGDMELQEDSYNVGGDTYKNVALMAARGRDTFQQKHTIDIWNTVLSLSVGDYRTASIWCFVLWFDPSLPAYSASSAPKAVRLGAGGPDQIFMTTGLGNPDATWASFGAGKYLYGHQHSDAGSFTINRKGTLIIDSGYYANYCATNGGDHGSSYYHRSIAHNVVHVYVPNEPFYWTSGGGSCVNDGGQVMASSAPSYQQVLDDPTFSPGRILYYETNDGYTYAQSDLLTAYDQEAISESRDKPFFPNKLTACTREFVFLRPSYFVVFDRVNSVNANHTKVWNLHVAAEPTIQGTGVQRMGNAAAGIWDYAGASVARVTDTDPRYDQGSLFLKSLLPKSRTIRKIGGNNRSAAGFAYWVGGIDGNGKYDPTLGQNHYWGEWIQGRESDEDRIPNITIGWGRIEVEATAPANNDFFLHVLYPCDASVTQMPDTRLVESNNMVGAEIVNDRVILFARTPAAVDSVTYTVASSDTSSLHTICNLRPSTTYRVFKSGSTLYVRKSGLAAPAGAEELITPAPTSTASGILSFQFSGENNSVQISGVSASFTGSAGAFAVTVRWTTDIASSSRVEYGPTPVYGSFTALDPALVTQHAVVLTPPAAENDITTYFRVLSSGPAGETGVSEGSQFLFDVVPPGKVTDLRGAQ